VSLSARPALGFAILLAASTTLASEEANEVPAGAWGGRGVAVTVEASGARVELDCAHGRIEGRLVLDGDNHFELPGTFVRERPGPVHMGPSGEAEEERAEPATYTGRLENGALKLSIHPDRGGKDIGPLEAHPGKAPTLRKCV
jgi:hypothetical protein